MNKSSFQQLEQEICHFRDWAKSHDHSHQGWECEYDEWPAIYTAFQAFLSEYPCRTWDGDTTELLLYAMARDFDCGMIAGEAAKKPERLLCLAQAALNSTESNAKWQIAIQLSRLSEHRADVETLLLRFFQDEDEYVRRQALMGLGRIGSSAVEDLAEAAWDTGHEYQRIGALYALHRVNSARLAEFRDRAVDDGRKYVVEYARRTRPDTND